MTSYNKRQQPTTIGQSSVFRLCKFIENKINTDLADNYNKFNQIFLNYQNMAIQEYIKHILEIEKEFFIEEYNENNTKGMSENEKDEYKSDDAAFACVFHERTGYLFRDKATGKDIEIELPKASYLQLIYCLRWHINNANKYTSRHSNDTTYIGKLNAAVTWINKYKYEPKKDVLLDEMKFAFNKTKEDMAKIKHEKDIKYNIDQINKELNRLSNIRNKNTNKEIQDCEITLDKLKEELRKIQI